MSSYEPKISKKQMGTRLWCPCEGACFLGCKNECTNCWGCAGASMGTGYSVEKEEE
ncbi:MAG: hypothetical protein J6D08_15040 [Lachnospiraceae bacterium]|nr:hypothetical protein [Lachnospiraceae bacterium]